jgi:hypothetical protein
MIDAMPEMTPRERWNLFSMAAAPTGRRAITGPPPK